LGIDEGLRHASKRFVRCQGAECSDGAERMDLVVGHRFQTSDPPCPFVGVLRETPAQRPTRVLPDMPITVYLLGQARGVPLSYLHVQLNPLALDWFYRSQFTIDQRVGQAADEAGTHAFATLYAGHPRLQGALWSAGRYDTTGLEAITDPLDWYLEVQSRGFAATSELLDILREFVPAPPGVDELDFYNFPESYAAEWAAIVFDPVAATAALETRITEPRRAAQEMIDASRYVTRLGSLLSADEMTVDPTFGFNPDLTDVNNVWGATITTTCDPGEGSELGIPC
jgi:hypothetical protein